jgi:hypothetical protein
MSKSGDLPEELRKQIDEALAEGHADKLPSGPPPRPRREPPRRPVAIPDPRPRTPKELLLVGALVALVGWVFRFPYSQTVLLIGIICVVVALLSMLIRPQGHSQHYWRGRPVDLPPESLTDRLYRLIYRG